MKQFIQNYRTGDLDLAEVPMPLCSSNSILVRNVASLVSIVRKFWSENRPCCWFKID
jgi:hypothetical protein